MRLSFLVICGVFSIAWASLEPRSSHSSDDSVTKSKNDLTSGVSGQTFPFNETSTSNNDIGSTPPVKAMTANRLERQQIQFDKYGYPIIEADESLEKTTGDGDTGLFFDDVGRRTPPFNETSTSNNDIGSTPPVKTMTANRLESQQIQFDKYGYPIIEADESFEKTTGDGDTDDTELDESEIKKMSLEHNQLNEREDETKTNELTKDETEVEKMSLDERKLDEAKADETKTNELAVAKTEADLRLPSMSDLLAGFRPVGCKANYNMIMLPLIVIPFLMAPVPTIGGILGSSQAPWCAERCKKGFVGIDRYCVKGNFGVKESYGRGVGEPFVCNPGLERSGLLCYPPCRDGYHGVGPVCWELCKKDYEGKGVYCSKTGHWYLKKSYTRGWGKPLSGRCAQGLEESGLLCYEPCDDGFIGVGPVCWKPCPKKMKGLGPLCYKGNYYERSVYKYY